MDYDKKNKLKRIGLWIGGITLAILLAGNIVTVTYVVASNKIETAKTNDEIAKLDKFRDETIKGTATQAQVNERLINQLQRLDKLEWRVNRLDKAHKFTPPEWDNIQVPETK
jgi:hypothetical protein